MLYLFIHLKLMNKILVIGSSGQIGTELVVSLRKKYGNDFVIASDIRKSNDKITKSGPFEILDVTDKNQLIYIIKKYKIKTVYLLAAILSAKSEKNIDSAWSLNMTALLNVLNLGREKIISKIFWPSSIAVFGPDTPKINTPQNTIMNPNTVYGISKLAGEKWCEYYFEKFNVDVRSIRYPGLIGWKSDPGGGTTDYAVEIFHKAVNNDVFTCFLSKNTILPMMYMEDAIIATIGIMEADFQQIKIRTSYNLAGFSFSPEQLHDEIKKHISSFEIKYQPDYRQDIAESWPKSIDDTFAKKDWNWKSTCSIEKMTSIMIENLTEKYKVTL